jgi:hypothetical protein
VLAAAARFARLRVHVSSDSCGTNPAGQQISHPNQVLQRSRRAGGPPECRPQHHLLVRRRACINTSGIREHSDGDSLALVDTEQNWPVVKVLRPDEMK